ncbi:MAG: hypothetical protein F6J89_28465, partial [Symploca sp. SIO1C4]|nr:hypothetical protein [Symploca sp. SIO1C4]
MNDIIYPTLDLFTYDLRNALGEGQEELQRNRDFFKKKLSQDLHEFLFQRDTVFEDDYIELLPKIKKFETSSETYPLEGYYYPVRLNDMYGLLLDCSVNNQTEAQPAASFKKLKAEIEQRLNHQPATIGQTWIISGWLPQSEANSPENIAKDCYKALMPGSSWERNLEGQGQFLGAKIFELSHYRLVIPEAESTTTIQTIQENQHVIIILYPDKATAEKSARFYHHWLRLFSYRHKVLWAYAQSRLLKRTIKNRYYEIEEDKQSISQNKTNYQQEKLSDLLRGVQDSIKAYTIELYQLEFQGGIIEINLSNYQKRLERIQERLPVVEEKTEDNLSFLDKFTKLVKDKYLLQIAKDSENLKRILKLQEDTINAVRSRVEVAKAQRDRNFQDAIAILGVGWTVASFVPSPDDLSETLILYNPPLSGELQEVNSPIYCPNRGSDSSSPAFSTPPASPGIGAFLICKSPEPWIKPAIEVTHKLSVALVAAALAWLL